MHTQIQSGSTSLSGDDDEMIGVNLMNKAPAIHIKQRFVDDVNVQSIYTLDKVYITPHESLL